MIHSEYWESINIAMKEIQKEKVDDACKLIVERQSLGGELFICGNGGSASTAEHATCDLSKGITLNTGRKFSAQCLTSNVSQLTAWSNDFGYSESLANILAIQACELDTLLVITGSGNSSNILAVTEFAKSMGIPVIGLTGADGGEISKKLDIEIRVQSQDMQIIENIHLSVIHLMYKIISAS